MPLLNPGQFGLILHIRNRFKAAGTDGIDRAVGVFPMRKFETFESDHRHFSNLRPVCPCMNAIAWPQWTEEAPGGLTFITSTPPLSICVVCGFCCPRGVWECRQRQRGSLTCVPGKMYAMMGAFRIRRCVGSPTADRHRENRSRMKEGITTMPIRANKPGKKWRCSWCNKSQGDVAFLIATPAGRPRAHICDECVAVCNSLLEDRRIDLQSDNSEQLAERKERAILLALKEASRLGLPVADNEAGGPGL